MGITKFAVKYPVSVLMITLGVCLLGIISYNKLGTDLFPDLKNPALYIDLQAGERPPEEIEKQFVEKIEAMAARQEGVKDVSSSSKVGGATITVEYDWDQDMDAAFLDLQRSMSQIAQDEEITSLNVSRYDANATPVMIISMSHKEIKDMNELRKIAENYMRSELVRLEGVADIQLNGQENAFVEVKTDSYMLEAFNLTAETIASKIESMNRNVSGGTIVNDDIQYTVKGVNLLKDLEDIGNIIVAFKTPGSTDTESGNSSTVKAPVYLKDVAKIELKNKDPENLVRYNAERSLSISVYKENKYNTVKAVENITAKLEELQKSMPGYEFHVISNQGDFIGASIGEVKDSAVMGILLAMLVLYVFLRRINTTLIVSVSIPVSIIATFNLMYFNGLSINIMTLGGLALGAGMLVDNAIVITDGIMVDMKRGIPKPDALVNITKKTAWALLGATTIGILTFLPIYMSPDTTGEYVRDLFIVLAVSLWLSWILALAYVPIQADRAFKPKVVEPGEPDNPFNGRIYRQYQRLLRFAIHYRWIWIVATVILLVFSVYGYRFIKQGFFPDLSYNQLYIEYKMPFGTNPETVEKDLASMEKYLMSRPEITAVTTSLGGTPSRYNLVRTVAEPALSYGELIVDFTSPAALKEHLNELQAYLSSHYPQAYVRMKQYNLMYMDFPIQFMISGPDPAVLKSLCAQVEGIMRADSSVMLVTNNWGPETPAMRVDYQQQTARDVNLSREDVGLAVLAATDGLPIGSYYEGEHPLPIYLKSVNDQGQRPGQIGNVPVWSMVPSTNGIGLGTVKELMTGMIGTDDVLKRLIGSVPLNQASSGVEVGWEVPVVRRYNGQRSIAVQCNNAPGYTTTAARNSLLPKIEALDIPPGYTTAWQGEYLASTQSQFYLFKNVPIAIVLILAILIALFKDFRKPLMILLCLPLAITGVVAGMLIAGKEFGFVAIVGALGLVGMMIKNGVVLVDEVDIQIRSGKDPFLALVDASTSRLRPVFLAAMTTILGMIPLVNDDMFGALAVTIMGGLFI